MQYQCVELMNSKSQREDEELYELIEPDQKKLVDEVIIRNSKY